MGGAVYTRASVSCNWAGAVMQKPLTEYGCDGPTDGLTDTVTYRVACTRLKIIDANIGLILIGLAKRLVPYVCKYVKNVTFFPVIFEQINLQSSAGS